MTADDLDRMLPDVAIRLDAHAADWRQAVELAGEALTEAGFATAAYTQEMIRTVEEHGAYIVIAPGIALAHARPSPAVLRTGLSWVRLAEPVEFGNPTNDPVTLVVGLAGRDEKQHLQAMSLIARALGAAGSREALASASAPGTVRDILRGNSTLRKDSSS